MIFVATQVQEKCREHCKDGYLAFINLSKAFHTVNRDLLWEVLGKRGVPSKFQNILRQLHDGMQACVSTGGQQSPFFSVDVVVKQGCVLAPTMFNLLISTVILLSHKYLSPQMASRYNTDWMVTFLTSSASKPPQSSPPSISWSYSMLMTVPSLPTHQNPFSVH